MKLVYVAVTDLGGHLLRRGICMLIVDRRGHLDETANCIDIGIVCAELFVNQYGIASHFNTRSGQPWNQRQIG